MLAFFVNEPIRILFWCSYPYVSAVSCTHNTWEIGSCHEFSLISPQLLGVCEEFQISLHYMWPIDSIQCITDDSADFCDGSK